jgi:hypothetical protein
MARYPQRERLLQDARRAMRTRGLRPRTEATYLSWIEHFLRFHGARHPTTLEQQDAEGYLAHLANERGLSAKTRNLAASALAFLLPRGVALRRYGPGAKGPRRKIVAHRVVAHGGSPCAQRGVGDPVAGGGAALWDRHAAGRGVGSTSQRPRLRARSDHGPSREGWARPHRDVAGVAGQRPAEAGGQGAAGTPTI